MMSDPPATDYKDALTMTRFINQKLEEGKEQTSADYPLDGLIWAEEEWLPGSGCRTVQRLVAMRVRASDDGRKRAMLVSVHCEGDEFSELWRTEAKIMMSYERDFIRTIPEVSHTFTSWKKSQCNLPEFPTSTTVRTKSISVTIKTKSESFARRSIIDPESSIPDVILVLEGQKFSVNKQKLSDQSSYFNGLFFSNFMESNQEEIEIKDTNPEDFHEVLKMMRGGGHIYPTSVNNFIRYLTIADMYDIQIAKDRLENFLLSTDFISIHRKYLLAEEHNLKILKNEVLFLYKKGKNLCELAKSPEFAEFPGSMMKKLFRDVCNLLTKPASPSLL